MMKKTLISLLLLFAATAMSAQEIWKGDMNSDNEVNIADVTSLVDVVLGKAPKEKISASVDPYKVDNTSVVGKWYAPDGTNFTLNEDGTTNFPDAATFKFRPYQGTLMLFNASGKPFKTLVLNEVESSYLLAINYATGAYTYYTNSGSLASGISLSQTSLSINSGTTAQLSATLSPEGSLGTITWTSSDESVATVDASGLVTAVAGGTCTITATVGGSLKTATCSVTVNQLVTSITLSQTIAFLELDGFVRLTATVLPENAANKNVVWSSSNESVAPVRSGRVDAYDYGTAIITCEAADGSGVKATCVVCIVDPTTYVDLGLPSGTLWATCNIGASSPEDYGDYFAWGETSGYNDGKANFSWSNYKWCEGSINTLTKYCNDSSYGYNGFTDDKTELDLEDDAAYVNWGPAWRMPSLEQYQELINSSYTTTEWTTLNGVYGRKITSKMEGFTDKSIFLPAAGHYEGSSLNQVGSYGRYWTRSYITTHWASDLKYAYCLCIVEDYISVGGYASNNDLRCLGRSVRPVRILE